MDNNAQTRYLAYQTVFIMKAKFVGNTAKGRTQDDGYKKTKRAKLSGKLILFIPCVTEGKKC